MLKIIISIFLSVMIFNVFSLGINAQITQSENVEVVSIDGIEYETTTVIGNWASVIGLGSLAVGYTCSGSFSYEQWRTSAPVSYPGYSYKLYMFRNQNAKVSFSVKGKGFNHSYPQVGGWFNSTRAS